VEDKMSKCTDYFKPWNLYSVIDDDNKLIGKFCDRCMADRIAKRPATDYEHGEKERLLQHHRKLAHDYPALSCPKEEIV